LSSNVVVAYLNKQYKYNLNSDYYDMIMLWADWWRGKYKPFHDFTELGLDNSIIKRSLYTLKMGKKVCEDWASILLNEKTSIEMEDKAASAFLQGKDGTGGVFGVNQFWNQGNALMEKAFYSGTGAVLLRLENVKLNGETVQPDKEAKIGFEYLSAQYIYPITVRKGKIIEVAFASRVLDKGKEFYYLERHLLEDGKYVIYNEYLEEKNGTLRKRDLPEGMVEEFRTGSDIPLFAIVSPNIVNHFDGNMGLGMSIFADAIDNLQGVDLAFNNFCRDLKLGGKKVFFNKTLVQVDEKGNTITPDDVAQQLFMTVGDEVTMDENTLIHEFNPALRIQEDKDAVQAQLDYLSFKCGLGTKHYQFNAGSIVTATQYTGDKQELVQNASKHYIAVEQFIKDIVRAVLWAAKTILGETVGENAELTVNFEDSYIIDKESERVRDQQEVRDGIMQKYEYRMKWYGEDEATAKSMIESNQPDKLQFEE